jgi:PAS domain S-box-containing protein
MDKLLTPLNITAVSIIPFVATVAVWTNDFHGLIWPNITANYSYPIDVLTETHGILFWVSGVYCYILMFLGALVIIRESMRFNEINNKLAVIIIGVSLPLIVKAVNIFWPGLFYNLDITPLVFTLCWCMVCWYGFRYRLLDLVPIARDAFIEQMSDGVIVVDMDGSLLYHNQTAREITLNSSASAIGQPVTTILPCCHNLAAMTNTTSVISLGKNKHGPHYYEIHTTILRDQDNKPGGYLINLRNVTERIRHEGQLKQYREQLEEEVKARTAELYKTNLKLQSEITEHKKAALQLRIKNELIDRILECTPNSVAVIGARMQILLANPVFCRTFNLKKDDVVGKQVVDIFPLDDWTEKISKVLKGSESQLKFEFKQTVEGKERIIIANLINMQENEVLLIMIDITDERNRQERMYFTDRLASIGQIAAGIAHELNNPLTCVISLSQLLLEDGIPEDIREELNTICSEAQRAGSIVRGLLAFSRHQASIRQSVQLNDILWEVLKLRSYEHRVKNIRVITEFAPGLPEIQADKIQLQQVFMNIIVNAEDAVMETHNNGTLSIITKHINNIIKISFTDNGCGIADDNMNRLFEPFFTTKSMGKGTGLGLSICYGIITKHNGKIYPLSKQGKGTTFIIELPLETANGHDIEDMSELYKLKERPLVS